MLVTQNWYFKFDIMNLFFKFVILNYLATFVIIPCIFFCLILCYSFLFYFHCHFHIHLHHYFLFYFILILLFFFSPRSIGNLFSWGPVATDNYYHRETRFSQGLFLSNITVRQPMDTIKELKKLNIPVIIGKWAND